LRSVLDQASAGQTVVACDSASEANR
jgi:hypothetical protein